MARAGRPSREPNQGERVGVSYRVTPQVKRALDAAADASGRSLSQEAEMRLEASFFLYDRLDRLERMVLLLGGGIAQLLKQRDQA